MEIPFTKMCGLGNDFIIFDASKGALHPALRFDRELIRNLSDRKSGIGCDQMIVLEPSRRADLYMRIFNADGSEAEACGNAARCVAFLSDRDQVTIETKGGILNATVDSAVNPGVDAQDYQRQALVRVTFPPPNFDWERIPLSHEPDVDDLSWFDLPQGHVVNVGNPHIVFFLEDVEHLDIATIGPKIERDPLFPERVNVNFAQVLNPATIRLRVWERGVGETDACGTGACATAVMAMHRLGHPRDGLEILLRGGILNIAWPEEGPENGIVMCGAATKLYRGFVDL